MNRKQLRAAWDVVSSLSHEALEAIAIVIENKEPDGDYGYGENDSCGGSTWGESVSMTLNYLANTIRKAKSINDKQDVLDPL